MELKNILLIAIVFILLWWLIKYITRDVTTLSGLTSGKTMQQVSPSDLDSSSLNTSNFSYSIWFYVDDWNYRYGEPKIIFGRMMNNDMSKPCPSVTLGAMQNDLSVTLSLRNETQPETPASTSEIQSLTSSAVQPQYQNFTCSVANIPIQRWVNLMISVYGRTLDIYIDGKLVRTCVMPSIAVVDSTAPLFITPNNGFSGWTTRLQYWSDAINPQIAWNVYKKGFGGSTMGNLFGNYGVKVAFMEGDQEKGVIKI
jgi:hypothetical protein